MEGDGLIAQPSGHNTMATTGSHPQMSHVSRNRYGKYDFQRFDDLVCQYVPTVEAQVGKIDVGCRFLFKKSKWGIYENKHSAGIIYLDLTFNHQQHDYRLKSATVEVTLDDEDEDLLRQLSRPKPAVPLQLVTYGPRRMAGEPRYEAIATRDSLKPTFDVAPFGGIGGMGREKQKFNMRECRWTFEGHMKADSRKGRNDKRTYKVVQWHLTENQLENQSTHDNIVHTGFSFVHGAQPFFIRVQVSGKLESRRSELGHRLRHGLRKLKFPANPQAARNATMLVNFDGQEQAKDRLDGLMDNLEVVMASENMGSSVEVSADHRAAYYGRRGEAPTVLNRFPSPHFMAPERLYSAEVRNMVQNNIAYSPASADDATAPSVDNIHRVSSTWLMASPMEVEEIRTAGAAVPNGSAVRLPTVVEEASSGDETTPRKEPEEEEEEEEANGSAITANPIKDAQAQLADGQVDLRTLIFLMRMWVVQAFLEVLGTRR
ncbi:hypothetical protein F4778DRAFT_194386 [Xylariomycetidae sp. FL2044]|nr:hypothetical protein F4778DRAFT_194386 [Xylariomycetidae sp. FL2044]